MISQVILETGLITDNLDSTPGTLSGWLGLIEHSIIFHYHRIADKVGKGRGSMTYPSKLKRLFRLHVYSINLATI